jgi:hypothetical protein
MRHETISRYQIVDLTDMPSRLVRPVPASSGKLERVEQHFFLKRFAQETDRPMLHGSLNDVVVAMRGHEYQRNAPVFRV